MFVNPWLFLLPYLISNQAIWGPLQNNFHIFILYFSNGHCLISGLHNLSSGLLQFLLIFLSPVSTLINPPSPFSWSDFSELQIRSHICPPWNNSVTPLCLWNHFQVLSLVYMESLLALFDPHFSALSQWVLSRQPLVLPWMCPNCSSLWAFVHATSFQMFFSLVLNY